MKTRPMIVTGKQKAKLQKAGVLVESKSSLPSHLADIFEKREQELDMHEVTVNLEKYDDFHPIHAML